MDGWPGVEEAAAEADLLLDIAYDTPKSALALFRRTALLDLDPGLLQLWMSQGKLNVSEHDINLTIGETVGTSEARFPDCDLRWHRTPSRSSCAWPATNRAGPVHDGHELVGGLDRARRRADLQRQEARLPPLRGVARADKAPLELALTLDDYTAETDVPVLESGGWSVRDAWEVCSTPDDYRAYIRGSRAEFSCAKPSCALLANAWISDRTLCYLASAKPAVVEHTGPSRFLPDAEGLMRFQNMEEAVAAIEAVEADYDRHSRSARELAEEHFDGEKVLRRVLELALA